MVNTKVTPRKTIEVKIMVECLLCKEKFPGEEQLKNHLLGCVKERSLLTCNECGGKFKKKEYLKRHLKRMHGQGSSKDPGVKLVEVVPEHKDDGNTEEHLNDQEHEEDKNDNDDDLQQYDPGQLIGSVSSDSDSSEVESSDEEECLETKNNSMEIVAIEDKATEKKKEAATADIQIGRTVRKPFSPSPVHAPKRKVLDKMKTNIDENANVVQVVRRDGEEEQPKEPRLVKKRKLTRKIIHYVEDNQQVEKIEEVEEWFEF